MRNYSNRFGRTISTLLAVVAVLVFEGCSMTADDTLGSNIMPEGQIMTMRHLTFRGSKMIAYNAETEKNEVTDTGKEFDPTLAPEADITLSADDREIGGLGIFLIRQIMNEVRYERIDGKNVLTLEKRL